MNVDKKTSVPAIRWQWEAAINASTLPAMTRDILRVVSSFMNSGHDYCFPSLEAIIERSGRNRSTVRRHLNMAEGLGWVRIENAGRGGQDWRLNRYYPMVNGVPLSSDEGGRSARHSHEPNSGDKVGAFGDEGGCAAPHKVGAASSIHRKSPDKTPNNIPNMNAGARGLSPVDRRRSNRAFERLWVSWPRVDSFSHDEAKREWDRLSDDERRECSQATPGYLRWVDRPKSAPSEYLRGRMWRQMPVPDAGVVPKKPAKGYSNLWMATWLARQIRAARLPVRFTVSEQRMIDLGKLDLETETLRKIKRNCEEAVRPMLISSIRKQPFRCSVFLEPIATSFRWVEPKSNLLDAWRRLHERRNWKWFDWLPEDGMCFPPVDPSRDDLDAAVEAAVTELETLISKV